MANPANGMSADPTNAEEATPMTDITALVTESVAALAEVLAAHRVTGERLVPEHGCDGDMDRRVSMCPVPYAEVMPPEEVAATLIASGAIRPAAEVRAEAWDEGCASGKSRAMRYMSDEPSLSLDVPNPYRAALAEEGGDRG